MAATVVGLFFRTTVVKRELSQKEELVDVAGERNVWAALLSLLPPNNVSDNCSFEDVDKLMRSLELVIYAPTFIFGMVLNTMALVVFCILLRKWTESSIYMTNLALMDLLLLMLLPFKMHATNNPWSSNMKSACSFFENMYFVGMYGSIYTIVCIAVHRYIAIRHPFRAQQLRSKKISLGVCLGIWVSVLLAVSPAYSFGEERSDTFHCFHEFSNTAWDTDLIVFLELCGFLLPATVLVVCSCLSIRGLRESERFSKRRHAGVRIIYSSLCAFLVPFTPCHVAILLQCLVRQKIITNCEHKKSIALFVQLALCLANITSFLDALCYYFIAKEVRSLKPTRMSVGLFMGCRRASETNL
ncbi:G-protein coupled receptor 55-like [Chanos chanos]|uniref:G-protein coupled receptor 55-like n=1 Tax=Chanos chanos TaxID=29144 RepID=A0A6J2WFB9_CHACN|nr:G-protein coupled receptor 55-like [Chanos chanos]